MGLDTLDTFDTLIDQGWNDHAEDAEGVFTRLQAAVASVETPAQALALARLAAHVAGEHLGRWAAGVALLNAVLSRPTFDTRTPEGRGVHRLLAALHRADGDDTAFRSHLAQAHEDTLPEASTRLRVLATTAAMLVGQGRLVEGVADFEAAVRLADDAPDAADPAARELAVVSNNLACALEDRAERTPAEVALMLEAAHVARRFWAVAGGWLQIERAEYRLCMSHLAAGRPQEAARHAAECLRIVQENGGAPEEAFFAHEASARAARALAEASAGERAVD